MTSKIDEIGPWSEVKLEILRRYAAEYSKILDQQPGFHHSYIDGFAGAGYHWSKSSDEWVEGSPLNALSVQPPFREYHFVDLDGDRVEGLRQLIGPRSDVQIYRGDCNQILAERIFPSVQYSARRRALCVLDPYGLHLDWSIVATAGAMRSVEVFINFPIYDININVLKSQPEDVLPVHIERMNKFWGDDSWLGLGYDSNLDLFGENRLSKVSNDRFAEAYRERLRTVAGFQFVPKPVPMRNSKGSTVYYLFFASQNKTGGKILDYIFQRFARERGPED